MLYSQQRRRIPPPSPCGLKTTDTPISLSGALTLRVISSPNACVIPFNNLTAGKSDSSYSQPSVSVPWVPASSSLNTKEITLNAPKGEDGGTHSTQSPAIFNSTKDSSTNKIKSSANPPQLSTTSNANEPPARKPKKIVLSNLGGDINSGGGSGRYRPGLTDTRSYAQVASTPPCQKAISVLPLRHKPNPSTKQTYRQALLNGPQRADQVPLGGVDTVPLKSSHFPCDSMPRRSFPVHGSYTQATLSRLSKPIKSSHNGFADKKDRGVFLRYAEDITSIPKDILHSIQDKYFIIHDLYPKSTLHFLVLPLQIIEKLEYLRGEDGIAIILGMQKCGQRLIDDLKVSYPHLEFSMGFHILPTMFQVHLHVISTDFCSERTFKGHHYNGFNTDYFLTPENAIQRIRSQTCIKLSPDETRRYKKLRNSHLKCNQCNSVFGREDCASFRRHLAVHLDKRKDQ